MSDALEPVPQPTVTVVAPVVVSPAQLWSAAIQNIVIAGLVSVGFFVGRVPMEVWLAVMGYIAGVDLFGRKVAATGSRAMALAIGATGSLATLVRHFGIVTILILAGSTLASCASVRSAADNLLPAAGQALIMAQQARAHVVVAREKLESISGEICTPPTPIPAEECLRLNQAIKDAHTSTDEAADALNLASGFYNMINQAALDAAKDGGAP